MDAHGIQMDTYAQGATRSTRTNGSTAPTGGALSKQLELPDVAR